MPSVGLQESGFLSQGLKEASTGYLCPGQTGIQDMQQQGGDGVVRSQKRQRRA